MPQKNEDNDLEHELSYCGKLAKEIESDLVLRSLPKIKEKLTLLKETIEDTRDHYALSKDPDAGQAIKQRCFVVVAFFQTQQQMFYCLTNRTAQFLGY